MLAVAEVARLQQIAPESHDFGSESPHGRLMVRPRRHSDRSGFTLFELLLVLAILVIFAAIASIPIKRFLDGQRLHSEAERVRVRWGQTRLTAMKSGRIYVFQFRPSETAYRVKVWASAEDEVETTNPATETGAAPQTTTTGTTTTGTNSAVGEWNLPEGLTFGAGQTLDERADVITKTAQEQGLDGWSPPILFYPDGTTSTTRLLVTDAQERMVQLDLRGLTGISRSSAPDPEAQVVR